MLSTKSLKFATKKTKKFTDLIKQGTTHNDPNVEDYFLANVEVTPWTQGVS